MANYDLNNNQIHPGNLDSVFKDFFQDKYGYSLVVKKNFKGSVHINKPIYLDGVEIEEDIQKLINSLNLIDGFKFKFKQFKANKHIVLYVNKYN
ncbi:MAG: hypothetical protein ACOC1K_03630 [Nanoarchaeota archaeon]